MKQGRTLVELAQEIQRQNDAKKDFLADTRSMRMNPEDMKLEIIDSGKENLLPAHSFEISDIAHQQIGSNLGIPAKYYERMREAQPELLAENVNVWLQEQPQNRMIRTLDEKRARAFLSDRYRRIDNAQIAETVIPILADIPGVEIASCEITDRKLYIKVLNPRLEAEVSKGDIVQAGIQITNSEVGLGSLQVLPLIYRLVCTNGMVVNDAGQRRKHVGRVNEANEDFSLYESDTIMADEHAFMLKVRDTVKSVSEQVHFDRVVSLMREAKEAHISGDIPTIVELTAKEYNLTKAEGSGVLDHLIRGGDLSLFGLSSAITRHSQDIQTYDRASDLESIGYDVLSMSRAQWNRLNQAIAA